MEIMIAVIMLGMMMSAIFNLQNTTFGSVVDFSARLRHIFSLKDSFIDAALQRVQQKEEPQKPTTAQQPEQIKYSLEKINEKSELKKFENVFMQKAVAQWQEGIKKHQEVMITFLYKAPEKKENEKK
jgi:hypothetical protein